MKRLSTLEISLLAFGISVNVLGTLIAFGLQLPILLDSIGTIFISILLGPGFGIITGLGSSLVSGITFDIYSLYFAPVQVFVAMFTYLMYSKGFLHKIKRPLGVMVISIFSATMGAIIAAFVFGGITSSGSSYIVAVLSNLGVNKVVSVFIVQFLMDYADRFLGVTVAILAIAQFPKGIMRKLADSNG